MHIFTSIVISALMILGATAYQEKNQSFGANSTISNLPELTALDGEDLFATVDTSAGQTRKLTWDTATTALGVINDARYSPLAGSASITTLGTITSGTWNGTAITIPYGGTGSTTLASLRLLLGNGTGALQTITPGISGQVLTSNGTGVAPSFQSLSVDQAANYVWTGLHTFNASTSLSATTSIDASNVNSNALILNGVAYALPATRGASSTALVENGNGQLTWQEPHYDDVVNYTVSTKVGTSTFHTFAIPNPDADLGYTITGGSPSYSAISTSLGGSGAAGFSIVLDTSNGYRFNTTKDIRLKFNMRSGATQSDRRIGIGLGLTADYSNFSGTTGAPGNYESIRFVVDNATLKAVNGTGAALTSTTITGITVTDNNTYEIVWNPGVDAKFYVNGNLYATHTTNLPSSATDVYLQGRKDDDSVDGIGWDVGGFSASIQR